MDQIFHEFLLDVAYSVQVVAQPDQDLQIEFPGFVVDFVKFIVFQQAIISLQYQLGDLLVLLDVNVLECHRQVSDDCSEHDLRLIHCREDLLGVLCVADDFECQLINVEGFERNVLDIDAALHVRQAQHLK